jgi:hypothetical protein
MTDVHSVNTDLTEEEKALAEEFYAAIQASSHGSERSVQARQYRVGVSDLGFCPERTRRMLDQQDPEDTDVMLAWLGTAIGDHAEKAYAAANPGTLTQVPIEVRFRLDINGEPYQVTIPGHPDIVEPHKGRMLDVKTDYRLVDAERNGASTQQRFQRHLYGLGCFEAGLFAPTIGLDDVVVGNVWIDRSGQDKYVHTELEKLDLGVVDAAKDWLEDVIYHQVNGQEAEKVPPREMCEVVCGFYTVCRAPDTDVSGLIEDPWLASNVATYIEGRDLEREGKRLKDAAKLHLEGIGGMVKHDGQVFALRHTWVNDAVVGEYVRRGYSKIDLRPMRKKR